MKKYCALKKLNVLGDCKFDCHDCSWSMTASELDGYIDRQDDEMERLEKMGIYKYSLKGVN